MDAAWEQIRCALFGLGIDFVFFDFQHFCTLDEYHLFDATRKTRALKVFPISPLAVFYI